MFSTLVFRASVSAHSLRASSQARNGCDEIVHYYFCVVVRSICLHPHHIATETINTIIYGNAIWLQLVIGSIYHSALGPLVR